MTARGRLLYRLSFEFRRVPDSLHDELSGAISTLTSVY